MLVHYGRLTLLTLLLISVEKLKRADTIQAAMISSNGVQCVNATKHHPEYVYHESTLIGEFVVDIVSAMAARSTLR